jgi:hypothetical protein
MRQIKGLNATDLNKKASFSEAFRRWDSLRGEWEPIGTLRRNFRCY